MKSVEHIYLNQGGRVFSVFICLFLHNFTFKFSRSVPRRPIQMNSTGSNVNINIYPLLQLLLQGASLRLKNELSRF